MVSRDLIRRIVGALGASLLVLLLGSSYSYAADCVGPDDPPGCVTPSPTPSATPTPTPDPSVSATPDPVTSGTPPTVVVLTEEQWGPLIWCGGALLCMSLIGVIGSWSR